MEYDSSNPIILLEDTGNLDEIAQHDIFDDANINTNADDESVQIDADNDAHIDDDNNAINDDTNEDEASENGDDSASNNNIDKADNEVDDEADGSDDREGPNDSDDEVAHITRSDRTSNQYDCAEKFPEMAHY